MAQGSVTAGGNRTVVNPGNQFIEDFYIQSSPHHCPARFQPTHDSDSFVKNRVINRDANQFNDRVKSLSHPRLCEGYRHFRFRFFWKSDYDLLMTIRSPAQCK